LFDSEESSGRAVRGRRRGWIPLDEPETKKIVRNRRKSEMGIEKGNTEWT
jgi:hypothetical protein